METGGETVQAIGGTWIETWIARVKREALSYLIDTENTSFICKGFDSELIIALSKVIGVVLKLFYN